MSGCYAGPQIAGVVGRSYVKRPSASPGTTSPTPSIVLAEELDCSLGLGHCETMAATPGFIHLRAHSAYSLLEGALPVKGMAKLAKKDSQPALAITDRNNLFGALEFAE